MTPTALDILHIIIALTVLLFFSHFFGYLFQAYKQPRVIGEILAGLILGPSLIAYFFPNVISFIFQYSSTKEVLSILYQLGLFHLMFRTGMELKTKLQRGDKLFKTASWIAAMGMAIPFACSFLILGFVDIHQFMGTANNELAFIICFSIAVAITSIPIIARILHDLKVLSTPFSRIILSAAVVEDIVLYVTLTIALGLVGTKYEGGIGLPALLEIENSGPHIKIAYHTIITIGFFIFSLWAGPRFFRWLDKLKFTLYQKLNPLAFLISFMLFMTAVSLFLDITPMFGAFIGGILAQNFHVEKVETAKTFESYSFAFFIPIYFFLVGMQLDLIHDFPILFFIGFLLACCVVKFLGVYWGARLSREKPWGSLNFGVALNARGAPAIVLASLALDSGIINLTFFTILVMFALVTAFLAGSWLNFVVSRKLPLK